MAQNKFIGLSGNTAYEWGVVIKSCGVFAEIAKKIFCHNHLPLHRALKKCKGDFHNVNIGGGLC